MDTSMDDLFSDLEKSAHPVGEQDDVKRKVDSFTCHEFAFDERLDVTIWHSEQYENALVYEIRLFEESSGRTDSIELLVPAANECDISSVQSKWPLVRPCVLSRQANSSTGRSPSIPVFTVPDHLMRVMWPSLITPDNPPRFIWLLSLSNGWIYAFGRQTHSSTLMRYATLCGMPVSGPVTNWALLSDPIFSEGQSDTRGNRPVSTVLLAFNSVGSGLALWTAGGKEENISNSLMATEFHVPPAPSQLCHAQVHGSWVHLVSECGHLLSLHCSVARISDRDDQGSFDLFCQPANFPRVPSLLHPSVVRGSEADRSLQPRWRYFDVADFARLPDGHLGIVQRNGRTATRLVDLLCGPELTNPYTQIRNRSDQPDAANHKQVSDLIFAHSYYQTYLRLLNLCSGATRQEKTLGERNTQSLERLFKIRTQWSPVQTEEQTQWRLNLDVNMQIPNISPSLVPSLPEQWDSLTEDQVAWLLLRPHAANPLYSFGTAHDVDAPLDLVVRVCPVYLKPGEEKSDQPAEYDGPVRWSYAEPWWYNQLDEPTAPESKFTSGSLTHTTIRRLVLSSARLAEFYGRLMDDPTNDDGFVGFRVQLCLAIRPPFVPASALSSLHSQSRPYRIIGPSLQAALGSCVLDSLHWLSPITTVLPDFGPLVSSEAKSLASTPPSMHFRLVCNEQLTSILSCIFKTSSHIDDAQIGLSSVVSEVLPAFKLGERGAARLQFLPTGQHVRFSWSWFTASQSPSKSKENHLESMDQKRRATLRISTSCLRTLWSLRKAVERHIRCSQFSNNSDFSTRPTVEDLRQEYVLLKNLTSTLKNLRDTSENANISRRTLEDLICPVLETYCSIRNSDAAKLFF